MALFRGAAYHRDGREGVRYGGATLPHHPLLAAHMAATLIAAVVRGVAVRARVVKSAVAGWVWVPKTHPPATVAAAKFAAFAARHHLPLGAPASYLLHAVTSVQAWWRMVRVRWYWRRHRFQATGWAHLAAGLVQRWWRDVQRRAGRLPRSPADIIQRAWRRHCDRRTFRYYRNLLAFRNAGDPRTMLRSIIPAEAGALLDRAVAPRVRFRLGCHPSAASQRAGGDASDADWPPTIYFKVTIQAPLCDVNAFAPRVYHATEGKAETTSSTGGVGGMAVRVGTTLFAATPATAGMASAPLAGDATPPAVYLVGTGAKVLECAAPPSVSLWPTLGGRRAQALRGAGSRVVAFGSTAQVAMTTTRPRRASVTSDSVAATSTAGHSVDDATLAATTHALPFATTTPGRRGVLELVGGATGPAGMSMMGCGRGGHGRGGAGAGTVQLRSADEVLPDGWYTRDDACLNSWRPVSLQVVAAAGDDDVAVQARRALAVQHRSRHGGRTKQAAAVAAKRARRRWLMSMHRARLAHDVQTTAAAPPPAGHSGSGAESMVHVVGAGEGGKDEDDDGWEDDGDAVDALLAAMAVHSGPGVGAGWDEGEEGDAPVVAAGDGDGVVGGTQGESKVSVGSEYMRLAQPVPLTQADMAAALGHSAGYLHDHATRRAARQAAHAFHHPPVMSLRWASSVDFDAYMSWWREIGTSKKAAAVTALATTTTGVGDRGSGGRYG